MSRVVAKKGLQMKTKLTNKEISFLSYAVSRLSNGGHPILSKQTLPYFKNEFLVLILNKAKSKVTKQGLPVIESILNKLSK